jgi:hypothetical protein
MQRLADIRPWAAAFAIGGALVVFVLVPPHRSGAPSAYGLVLFFLLASIIFRAVGFLFGLIGRGVAATLQRPPTK